MFDPFYILGFLFCLLLLGLSVSALLLALKARSETRDRDERLDRLDRILKVVVDRTRRMEEGLSKEPAPPLPVPQSGAVPRHAFDIEPAAQAGATPWILPPASAPDASRPEPSVPRDPILEGLRHAGAEPGAASAGDAGPLADAAAQRVPAKAPESLESFLGGRVFLVVGIVVAVIGLGWFLKVAVDRDWIGPGARVALGVAAGIAALVVGDRMRARGLGVFGQGLMGGGLGAFYVTVFFACVRYGFLERPGTYGVMLLLTAGGAFLAAKRDAPLLAYLGFLGGFLTPAVLTTGEDRLWALTGWLAVLDAGVLAVAARRAWRGLDLMALLFTAFYYGAWLDRFFSEDRVGEASGVLSLLAALALAAALAPPIARRDPPHPIALVTSLLSGIFAIVAGAVVLHPLHRQALGAGVAGLAGVYVLATRLVATRCNSRSAAGVLLALGLASAAIAVPFVFEGRAVAPAWAAAGVALIFLASRGAPGLVAVGGMGMLALAAGEAVLRGRWIHDPGMAAVGNAAFASVAFPGAALLAGGLLLRPSWKAGFPAPGALLVGGTWLLALAAGAEAWQVVADALGKHALEAESLEAAAAGAVTAGAVLAAAVLWKGGADAGRALVLLPAFAAFIAGSLWVGGGRRPEFTPVLNAGFLCGLGTTAAALAAGALSPRTAGRVLQVAALAFLFAVGTGEIFAWGGRGALDGGTRMEAEFRAQVVASVAWALYAAALLCVGFLRGRADIRWTGIVLFGFTLVKVLFHDTAALDAVYRVGSFLVLGLLLVAASRLYQRRKPE
jgi:uncharacterized membrane protein